MNSTTLSYQNLTPECQLDALASIGIYPETGLLALNSYENRVYSFKDENQHRYVVKFYRPGRWSEQQLLEDHDFSLNLSTAGLHLSAPIEIAGKTLHLFAGYYFALFDNLSARSLAVDNIDSLYDVGIALGKLHKASEQYQFKYRPTLNVLNEITLSQQSLKSCEYIPNTIKPLLFKTIEQIQEKISVLALPKLPLIAIHGDAHASNILLKDEQPYWVDFDDCKMEPAVQDIWMLLNGTRNEQQVQLSMLLEGYQEERDFDTKQLAYIEVLRTMRIINYVSWINNRWEDPAFYLNFPWFITDQYWKELLQSLQQQLSLLDEAPLALQPQY
ncbi:serine/threonine protein kinase [Psychromonas sp. RZ22]|uniref:serine/threonine protein kinase n=1 Tax=Psychromonas algarum TaxID=2555643 RepID=UPI001067FBF8|nr:serine/threonine protein kinase [Psychromonas sp. RZ22]TEW54117.1 serine/threonine protein kinase [Psychromonas sp. RZ22]